jgi:alkyldihydroxyacetonephosphate synthase
MNLGRMTRLLHLDKRSQLATLQAGVAGPMLEAQLRAQGYTLGHFPQSFEYSTLGGWVVTRSSGQQSLRYGRIEQLFAGGRLETPVGRLDISTVPASSAGPDLREIVMGSEGRFGVLTEATVRVTPVAEHESFHAIFFPDWASAEAAVRSLVQRKLPLSMLRLSNTVETETNLTLAGHASLIAWLERFLGWRGCGTGKCLLMLGVTGDKRTAAYALAEARRHCRGYGAVYIGTAMGNKWRDNRFKGPYLRNTLWAHGYAADTIETAVDWPRVTSLMQAMEQAAHDAFAEFGERVHAFTHLSHLYPQGSSIYSTFVYRIAPGGFAPNLERWQRYKARVSAAIVDHGGTISHQHGVGRDHAPYLADEKGPLGMATLASLSQHFDPNRIMNPGKLLVDGTQWAD